MKLTTHVTDNKQHVDLWLTLWQGGMRLTAREKDVLAQFIMIQMYLVNKDIKEPFLSKLLFDVDSRKKVCDNLSISSFNLTNVLSSLRSKEVMQGTGGSEGWIINPNLIPEKELIFEFK